MPSLMLTLSRSLRRTAAKPALMHRGSLCNEDEQRCSWLHAYGTEDKADYRHVLMVMEREDECSRGPCLAKSHIKISQKKLMLACGTK